MTTLTAAPAPARPVHHGWEPTGMPAQVRVLTRRSLRPHLRIGMLVNAMMEPLILLILFGVFFQALGNAPGLPPGVSYIDNLVPAILIISTLSNAMQSGTNLSQDLTNGVINRFRAMPVSMFSVLLARTFADSIRTATQLAILLGVAALLFDFTPGGGLGGVVAALLIAVVVGWSLSWIFLALSAKLRDVQALQGITATASFPLMFASNAFVTVEGLPGWLRAVAEWNPISQANTVARELSFGLPSASGVLVTLGLCSVLFAVSAPIAHRLFRRF